MTMLLVGLALVLAGGAVSLAARRRPAAGDRAFATLVAAGAAVALVPAVRVLAGGAAWAQSVGSTLPMGPWAFGLDPLSAFFLVVVLGVGAAAAVYGTGYLREERAERGVAGSHAVLALVIVALALVVTARAVLPFLVAWEVMAVGAFLLVMFEGERGEVRRAGFVYLAATHAGTLALLLLFAVWRSVADGWTFPALAAAAPSLPAGGALVLALGLIGFGLKAGLVPLHFWLPGAHAAAPSHVSALMSGVVIKMGVYGLLRLTMLLGHVPAWWGWLLLGLGLASGVLGVLWALAQHDVKRLLAYHSVENIGIILMGAGAGALGMAYGSPLMAALGFAGAVLHTLNHALFKSLLFLGAGAVARATGTRNLERLGGLARRMPVTWATFLIGAAAIVGLPPLNGFVSEWVVFQALFQGGLSATSLRLAVFAAAGLGLIGALALACFAKVSGVVFLGVPRSADAGAAREAEATMLGPMVALAAACVGIGLLPLAVVGPALRAGASVAGTGEVGVAANVTVSATIISLMAGLVAAGLALAWALHERLLAGRPVNREPTWACGYPAPSARMQYTASSFAAPILAAYGTVAGVRVERGPASLRTHPADPVLDGLMRPLWIRVSEAAGTMRGLQRGRLQVYLLFVVATVTVLLLYLVVSRR